MFYIYKMIEQIYLLRTYIYIYIYMCVCVCARARICVCLNYNVFKCNGIYHAVYNCKWYSLDPKQGKDLIPFMIKVNEPVYLTAGKVFPVTMAMFSNVRYRASIYIVLISLLNSVKLKIRKYET